MLSASILDEVGGVVSVDDLRESVLCVESCLLEEATVEITIEVVGMSLLTLQEGVPDAVIGRPSSAQVNGRKISSVVGGIRNDLVRHASKLVGCSACIGLEPSTFKPGNIEISKASRVLANKALNTSKCQVRSDIETESGSAIRRGRIDFSFLLRSVGLLRAILKEKFVCLSSKCEGQQLADQLGAHHIFLNF